MYLYQPLPPLVETGHTPPYTRILHLNPASSEEEPFSGRLELVNLDDPPAYEALSYTWGTDGPSNYIWLQGEPIPIQPNLEAALISLRYPSQVRRIWIDALCIDQSNVDERSRQVSYMRLVYKNCSKVIVWLGLKSPGVDVAFDAARKLSDAFKLIKDLSPAQASHTTGEDSEITRDMIQNTMASLPETAMLHIEELFNRPYFSRCWVVQEVGCGAMVTAKCEEMEMPFFDLASILLFWGSRHTKALLNDGKAAATSLHVWYNIASRFDPTSPVKLTHVEGSLGCMVDMLEDMRGFQATNPRDKIYSILGVCDEGVQPIMAITHFTKESDKWFSAFNGAMTRIQNRVNKMNPSSPYGIPDVLKPDYKKATAEVYTDVARYLIRKSPQLLDVLSFVQHGADPIPGEYPTWVPKWFEPKQYQVFRDHNFKAGICTPPLSDFLQSRIQRALAHPRRLVMDGFHVGVVQQVSKVMRFGRHHDERKAAVHDLWTQLFPFPMTPRPSQTYRTGEPLDEAFCRAITTSPLGVFNGHLLEDTPTLGIKIASPKGDPLRLESMSQRSIDTFLTSLTNPQILESPPKTQEANWFTLSFGLYASNRRTFITREGHIGIGPAVMKPGDEVVVLFRGRMPYVLRRNPDHHVLVGDCYVRDDDIMYGKVTENVRHGRGGPMASLYEIE